MNGEPKCGPSRAAFRDLAVQPDDHVSFVVDAEGLTFSSDAEKRALIRRATFDVVGLSTDLARVEEFVADQRPTRRVPRFETINRRPSAQTHRSRS
ncbi:MAG TPA: hypothetical protein DC048_12825 [Planctomycetaceae bacterium]|nr:hypothetical protein [Planctomycetaceae bacterium]